MCVHKVKWSIHICSYVSAADKNQTVEQSVLAVSAELPWPHEGLTNRGGLQSVSLHCVLAQESLFSSVDCTWTLLVSFFPLEFTSLCTSKVFYVCHSPLWLAFSLCFLCRPHTTETSSTQLAPWGAQLAPLGHLDPSGRAAAVGAPQVSGACVTSRSRSLQEKGREEFKATTHTLKSILPAFLTDSCLMGFFPVWVAFHFSEVIVLLVFFFFFPKKQTSILTIYSDLQKQQSVLKRISNAELLLPVQVWHSPASKGTAQRAALVTSLLN